jgi:hypothetical protein
MEPFAHLIRVTNKDAETPRETTNAGSISMTYNTAWKVESAFSTALPGLGEVQNPVQSILTSDIYSRAPEVKKSKPTIVDPSLPNIDKTIGFDPYDTGILQQQKIKG